MYFRKKTSGGRVYLQIAESRRVGGQVRQRVIATLGRLDVLAGERAVGAAGALGGAVRDAGDGGERGAGRPDGGGPADRAGPGVRALVGRDRLPGGDRGRGQGAQARVRAGAGDLPHRAAPADGRRLRPGGRSLARGLPDRRRRGAGAPSSLPGDGVARRGIAGARSRTRARRSPRAAPRTWSRSGCSPTGAICSAGSIWCSWTPPVSTSKARAGRPSAATATARTIARTSAR